MTSLQLPLFVIGLAIFLLGLFIGVSVVEKQHRQVVLVPRECGAKI